MIELKFITPIYLINDEVESTDNAGDVSTTPNKRKVFADKVSIGQNEFYQAHRSGLKPELRFNIRSSEYLGEMRLKFNNTVYSIMRTYDKQDGIMELTCSRENSNGNT